MECFSILGQFEVIAQCGSIKVDIARGRYGSKYYERFVQIFTTKRITCTQAVYFC
jgi:hypothetical protein